VSLQKCIRSPGIFCRACGIIKYSIFVATRCDWHRECPTSCHLTIKSVLNAAVWGINGREHCILIYIRNCWPPKWRKTWYWCFGPEPYNLRLRNLPNTWVSIKISQENYRTAATRLECTALKVFGLQKRRKQIGNSVALKNQLEIGNYFVVWNIILVKQL
jgi:hypothetical protein